MGTGTAPGIRTGMAPSTGTATATAPDRIGDPRDVDVLSLLRLRDQMKEQLEEYNSAVLANQETFIDQLKINAIEENFVTSAMKDLQRSIEEVKVSFQNKNLALQRVQIMDALRNKLEQDDEDSRLILETMKQIGLLSRTIIEYQQQADQKEQQMTDMRRKRLSLKADERQKLQQIQTVMKRQKKKQASVNVTGRANRLKKLERERQMTSIIQNVFQNIIIGSRVNWAKDPSLKAIVLRLEKSSYLQ
ncbi:centromere protein H [Hirundo rustica]|uniref:centromere protein H n=1 Tax=Hirundo rustica TaxID=43150 RepID=UPI001A942830|nr:centromere protein H [Hirundo rustica]